MNVVADVNTGGIGVYHLQAQIFALHLPHHFPPLLAVHLSPLARFWADNGLLPSILAFRGFLPWFAFHAMLLPLNSNLARPGRRNLHNLPSGVRPCSPGQACHHLHNRQDRSHDSYRADTLQRNGGLSCRAKLWLRFYVPRSYITQVEIWGKLYRPAERLKGSFRVIQSPR